MMFFFLCVIMWWMKIVSRMYVSFCWKEYIVCRFEDGVDLVLFDKMILIKWYRDFFNLEGNNKIIMEEIFFDLMFVFFFYGSLY